MATCFVPCPLCRAGDVMGTGPLRECTRCRAEFPRSRMGGRCSFPGCRRQPDWVCRDGDGWCVRCGEHAGEGERLPVGKTTHGQLPDVDVSRQRGRKRRRAGGHGYSGGDGFVEIDRGAAPRGRGRDRTMTEYRTAGVVETGRPDEFALVGPWEAGQGHNDVAHVVAYSPDPRHQSRVVATYLEPGARRYDWRWEDEMRDAIEAHVRSWASDAVGGGEGLVVQYDPGRDQAQEVVLVEAD